MKVDHLLRQTCEWLKGTGPNSDIVMSSRVRLARNLEKIAFSNCANKKQSKETSETLERAVVAEIDRLRTDGVHTDEVARVLALIETDYVSSLQTAGDRADTLSKFATLLGDPALVYEQLDRYRAVTAAEVTAFARRYLGEDNRASLVYVPRAAVEAA